MASNFIPPLPIGQFRPSSEAIASWLYEIWKYLQENPILSESEISGDAEEIAQNYVTENVPPMIASAIAALSYATFTTGTTLPIYRASNDEIGQQDLLEAWNDGCRFALVDDEAVYVMINNNATISLLQILTEEQTAAVLSVNGQTGNVVIPNASSLVAGLMSTGDKAALDALKTNPDVPFGTCDTAADVAAKTVTVSPAITSLAEGQLIFVKFANRNSAASPTLNVNNTGALPFLREANVSVGNEQSYSWAAGQTVLIRYENGSWMKITAAIPNLAGNLGPGLMTAADKSKLDNLHISAIRTGYVQVNANGTGPWAINASLNVGETFISWVGISSNGWVGAPYIEDSSNRQTSAWSGIAADGNNTYIRAYYLAGTFV